MGWPIGPFQLGFSVWFGVGPKRTNKTLAPIGLVLENTCYVHYVSFRIREQENVYLGVVKFKTEDQKFLGRLLIFTPIPLKAQDV